MYNEVTKAVESVIKKYQKEVVNKLKELKNSEDITKDNKVIIQKCIDTIKGISEDKSDAQNNNK